MTSITAWNRIEASTHSLDLERGLQARVSDPLWMLARQWQVGEFLGEDAPSPVDARLELERTRLTRLRLHGADDERFGGTSTRHVQPLPSGPLEALVEREAVSGVSDRHRAIEAGTQLLLRLAPEAGLDEELARTLRGAFRNAFPVAEPNDAEREELDAESVRFLQTIAGRSVDGIALRAATADAGPDLVPPAMGLSGTEASTARIVLQGWTQWYDARFSEPDGNTSAWLRERMEYSFAVSAPTTDAEVVLTANEYHGGHLDWYAFDVSDETSLEDQPRPAPTTYSTVYALPTRLTYPGMPATRFWEFEDQRVHLARYTAGPSDVSKVLLVEYAMVYGDDWFRIPVDMEVGDLVRVDSLVILDNFGDRTTVRPATQIDGPSSPWRLFTMAGDPALQSGEPSSAPGAVKGPWLLRPPSLARNVSGDALEEVVFARDEMANLAWAIERTVESATGRPLSRAERWLAQRRITGSTEEPETTQGDARYKLQATVPDYWIPLVPVQYSGDGESMILRRGHTLLPSGDRAPDAKGRVLEPGHKLLVFEEEVPESGIVVSRHWQMARWLDGSTWLWLARRKGQGRRERSSGLGFDLIEE